MAKQLSYNETMLRSVRKALQSCIEGGAKSASVSQGGGSKSYTRHSLQELQQMESYYVNKVNSERGVSRRRKPDFGGCN